MTSASRIKALVAVPILGAALIAIGLAAYLPAAEAPPYLNEGAALAALAEATPAAALGYQEHPDESRPLANVVRHWLLAGTDRVASIRVASAILHALSALLVLLLVRALLPRDAAAPGGSLIAPVAGALIFLMHPVATEALLAHGAFPLVLGTFLSTFSLLLAARAGSGDLPVRPFAPAALYLGALFCDSSLWPVAFAAAAFSRPANVAENRDALRSFLRRLFPYALSLTLFYLCWSIRRWPSFNLLGFLRPWGTLAGIASQSATLFREIGLLLVPLGLSADHGEVAYIGSWNSRAIAGAVLMTVLLGAGFIALRRRALPRAALGLYALLHVHFLIAPPEEPIAERRLYALLLAPALAGAAAAFALERRAGTRVAFAGAGLVVVLLGHLTLDRVYLWRDPTALWESAARVNPASPRPHLALANLRLARGENDLALPLFEAALARAPHSAPIQNAIAETYLRKGDYERAIQEAEKARALDPRCFQAHITAGTGYMMTNQPRQAFLAFNAALLQRPDDPSALYSMGALFFDQNRFAKAAELLQRAAQGRPRDPEILFRLGMSRLNTGDFAGAAEAMRACLAESPARLDAQINLGTILTQTRHYEEAAQILRAVVTGQPGNAKALNGLGVLASAKGQPEQAKDYFEQAVASDPNYLMAVYNLAGAYERLGDRARAIETYRSFLDRWTGALDAAEDARIRLARLETASSP